MTTHILWFQKPMVHAQHYEYHTCHMTMYDNMLLYKFLVKQGFPGSTQHEVTIHYETFHDDTKCC